MDVADVVASDFVNLTITSLNNEAHPIERRFKKGIQIDEFKNKLELLVGCSSNSMQVEIFNKNDDKICRLDENERTLGSYPIDNGMRAHVTGLIDQSIDESNVEKFELSEEEYAKRSDTVAAFLKEHKLGKYNEEEAKKREEEKLKEKEREEKLVSTMKIDDRCEVLVPGNPKRRATIKYIGKCDFKSGWWIGVKYDEPFGKNDGSVSGKRYFECPDKYGGFVRPACIVVGDFPEEDYDLNEEL